MEEMVVQLLALSETWSWKALAYAVSQVSATWQICWLEPRSTWSHCGSLNALDQRVPVLPSVALAAGVPAFSVEDAVVGRPSARLAPPPPPPPPLAAGVAVTSLELGEPPTALSPATK